MFWWRVVMKVFCGLVREKHLFETTHFKLYLRHRVICCRNEALDSRCDQVEQMHLPPYGFTSIESSQLLPFNILIINRTCLNRSLFCCRNAPSGSASINKEVLLLRLNVRVTYKALV
ncbi:hypothetical protein EUGRSUZ_L02440 [Eucalyptus grandis]|uniref:Uncharacterized protein n=1 Tax=Eucalyptus grandis TaxID=71139 RepID=A0A058ZQU6_EUCGR|nr:hypothetical protein EUGRSUZ_L02440 [Eucalyptus grandis]KAK2631793.1 hypothetical protein EUGRSUZ_L02440 [Eucalyptus grandis]